MTGAALITTGIGYDQHLLNIEAICVRVVERALERHLTLANALTPESGGIELAMSITRLSKSRIYNLVSDRAIPHSKRGNVLHFRRDELLAWIEAGKRQEK